jgi:hypothetical protein
MKSCVKRKFSEFCFLWQCVTHRSLGWQMMTFAEILNHLYAKAKARNPDLTDRDYGRIVDCGVGYLRRVMAYVLADEMDQSI